jgi:hypothetical protein
MNWLKRITEAATVEDVLQVANEYILEQPQEYLSWIPQKAQPNLVATEHELHDWNHRISQELGSVTNPNLRLQDLAVFFLRASARIHQLNLNETEPRPAPGVKSAGRSARRKSDTRRLR